MPGQCYKCGSEFSVFKKERGCKNCGYAFCNKCLNEKPIPVPKKNNEKHHVCNDCFKVLTGAAPAPKEHVKYDLPEAYVKRVAALEQRNVQPRAEGAALKSQDGKKIPESLMKLDKADREIALRLEKLREDDKPKGNECVHSTFVLEPITDAQLQARLAHLKGQPVQSTSNPVYQPVKRIPETQQVDDLLEQLSEEVALDARLPDPAEEVEERLRRFRDSQSERSCKPGIDGNNFNQDDKSIKGENNLNIVDKGRPVKKLCDKNITGTSTLEEQDLEEIHKMIAAAAKEVESDAQKVVQDLHRDKELMSRLKVLQAHREQNKHSDDAASVNSDTDNTTKSTDISRSLSTQLVDSDEDSDEDVAAAALVQRYIEETKIDEAVGNSGRLPADEPTLPIPPKSSKTKKKAEKTVDRKHLNSEPSTRKENSDSDYDDSDELPYCCLCTEDACIRCRDCDLDLYCKKCFVECHEKMDITDHRTVAYKAPKGYR
ncbi:abscission/NoCut checkpoint regulator [Biomphalaria pfeifferi]|uniref:Abscission/NoCut checkpoint regulator n=1 Tax=Biomphalaria pfeifferi TaxID=112525 RepID=A0AAD8F255_BIOPF|nr:abscission/NoCut checkpoint regulator [Biomphalaria pfeifferi]